MDRARLKGSQFIVGLVRALRGLRRDIDVLLWIAQRKQRIAIYLSSYKVKKLQLGSSHNVLEGWLNTDIDPPNRSVVYMDATAAFPFGDSEFDYIMAEHMIEHIEYSAGQAMLRECLRVLKPGGRVRFATPDLAVLLALYFGEKTESQQEYIEWAAARFLKGIDSCKAVFVINNAFQSWGHRFLYDAETLRQALYTAGFRAIKFYKPGDSEDPILRNLEAHGREIESEVINQFETMVAEALKER